MIKIKDKILLEFGMIKLRFLLFIAPKKMLNNICECIYYIITNKGKNLYICDLDKIIEKIQNEINKCNADIEEEIKDLNLHEKSMYNLGQSEGLNKAIKIIKDGDK